MDVLSLVIVGHIDHGKSTLIGRLLYDTRSLPSDKIEEIKKASAGQGRRTEFAYLLDHFEKERKQGITIDTTQVFFKTDKRRYVIIDAPGHVEFVKNMITGASQAEAAVLIVDVAEGVKEQTKRHSYLLSLLGIKQVIVVLNKMDLVEYSRDKFESVKSDVAQWLKSIDISALHNIPISAIEGENVASYSDKTAWYEGPDFLKSLDTLKNKKPAVDKALLFPIQDVYKVDDKRINVGRVESGVIARGNEITVLPGDQMTRVKSIEKYPEVTERGSASECIGFTTAGAILLERGNIVCTPGAKPEVTDKFEASIFWIANNAFENNQNLTLRCATQEVSCKIERINKRINSATLEIIDSNAETLKNMEVGEVVIKTKKPIAIKDFNDVQELGRFVLVRDDNICGGGIISI